MIPRTRDAGLQPERTALAWLRTYMLLIAMSVLLLKVGKQSDNLLLQLDALILIGFTGFFYFSNKKRFSVLIHQVAIIGEKEALLKKLLSTMIIITATVYATTLLVKFINLMV